MQIGQDASVEMVIVSGNFDAADDWIAERATDFDLTALERLILYESSVSLIFERSKTGGTGFERRATPVFSIPLLWTVSSL